MKKIINTIQYIILFVAILISLKITWLAGYLYLKMPIGAIFKLFHISDVAAHEYFWKYFPMNLDKINISFNKATLLFIPYLDLLLMQTIIITWAYYFIYTQRKNTYSFIKNLKDLTIKDKWNLGILLVILSLYGYGLIDIISLTYNNNEILEILKSTYFLLILQILIGYNIILHGLVTYLIFRYTAWSLLKKSIIASILIMYGIAICTWVDLVILWNEGYISIMLKEITPANPSIYLTEAIYEIYEYYGLNISFCNPDILNPCLEIKNKVDEACRYSDLAYNTQISGRQVATNVLGQLVPVGFDYSFGCSNMKKVLQDCIDHSMQDNFIKTWNMRQPTMAPSYVPREPFIIKLPKL